MCMTYKCFKCWLFLILIKNRYCKTNQSFCNILIYDCSHDILFTFSDLWVGNFVLKVHSSSITCLFYFYGIRDTFRDAFKPDFWKKKTWDFVSTKGGGSANPKLLSKFSKTELFLGTLHKCDETQRNMPIIVWHTKKTAMFFFGSWVSQPLGKGGGSTSFFSFPEFRFEGSPQLKNRL